MKILIIQQSIRCCDGGENGGHSDTQTIVRYDRRPEEAKELAAMLRYIPYSSRPDKGKNRRIGGYRFTYENVRFQKYCESIVITTLRSTVSSTLIAWFMKRPPHNRATSATISAIFRGKML